jgi:hypothetical protein
MPFTTLPSPARRWARSKACWESPALAATPDSITLSLIPSTRISESGSELRSAARMPLRSRVTAISKPAI